MSLLLFEGPLRTLDERHSGDDVAAWVFIARQPAVAQGAMMLAGLPAALLFAQAATAAPANPAEPIYGPAAPDPTKSVATPVKTAERECAPQNPDPKSNEIVVCAVKPQGYRIDPDVLAAKRMKKKGDAGPPHNPHETYAARNCSVGPAGCQYGGISLIAAAVTAATMVQKAVKGENVGKMFVTDPDHPSEYQLYQQAKREREEKEADAAAKAVTDAARAKAAAEAAKAKAAAPAQPQSASPNGSAQPASQE
jgi:hypothetical protein